MKQKIKSIIQNNLREKINLHISTHNPKGATIVAKKHFKQKPITVAEIGTYKGDNAKNLFKNLNIKKLYIIDPYKEYFQKEGNLSPNKSFIKNIENEMIRKLKKYKHKIIHIKKDSFSAAKYLPKNIDFIYIDGNHDYKFVRKDIEIYWNYVKKGGILAGNDIQYLSVSKAIINFSNKKNIINNLSFYKFDWILNKV